MRHRPALFDLVRAQVVVHLTSVRTGVPYPHSTVVEPDKDRRHGSPSSTRPTAVNQLNQSDNDHSFPKTKCSTNISTTIPCLQLFMRSLYLLCVVIDLLLLFHVSIMMTTVVSRLQLGVLFWKSTTHVVLYQRDWGIQHCIFLIL